MAVKKVKISAVKRAAHLKSKKTPLTKQQQQKIKQKQLQLKIAKEKGQNIFAEKAHKRDKLAQRKKQNKRATLGLLLPTELKSVDSDDDGEQMLDDVADMLDGDDLALLHAKHKQRKRKQTLADVDQQQAVGLEKAFASESKKEMESKKIKIDLLPIKSREGEIITRTTEVDYVPKLKTNKITEDEEEANDGLENESIYEDSDDDIVNNEVTQSTNLKMISMTDLLLAREQELERQKYRVGIICSGILEKPEDKIRNFSALFELMDETNKSGIPNILSVRKVAIISIAELFRDILPEYRVGQVDTKMQTVRKATLERVTNENALLQQFKKYLQKLEVLTAVVNKRNMGKRTPEAVKLATVAVQCMCDLLVAHPYFNYVRNIAQLLVYMLNSKYPIMRQAVNQCFRTLFASDKRLDMTLFVVRRINHLIKTKQNNVHVDCITCLLSLKIKNINLDAEKENELKQKKLEGHRQRLLNLSKKERKRRKKLAELNKELEEACAEENKQTKHYKLTEITKMVFTIYFRVLKNDPTSKVLSAVLEGLAQFAHIINLDFFSDLIDVLNRILEEHDLGYREQLHCIQTIFVILSGQGEVLNIDPIRFYQHFYRNMFVVNAGKNHDDFSIILRTLDEVLVKRRRNMSQQRLMAFIKRLLTVSLHLLHHGTLAVLGTIKTTFQLTSVLDALLDTDTSIGSGRYEAELEDPEYCNAACTSLYELTLLERHYHPTVQCMAAHIANGVPATGEGALPIEIGKLNANELFTQYDSTQMAFNPAIPVPKQCEPKIKRSQHKYLCPDFKAYYSSILSNKAASTSVDGASSLLSYNFSKAINKNI